jgi:putative transposase
MTRKRFSEEDILGILRHVKLELSSGSTVELAIRRADISDATYYKWRKLYGGVGKAKTSAGRFHKIYPSHAQQVNLLHHGNSM